MVLFQNSVSSIACPDECLRDSNNTAVSNGTLMQCQTLVSNGRKVYTSMGI